jgi:DNA-binding transcriptional LysR family regulator
MLHHLIALHALQPHALEYFSEVVETGSLRLAAQKFDVAPSAVSRQIARLEQDLGQDLFERSPKGMLPTAAARLVLEFLTETRLRAEKMRADINDLTDLKRGNVRLAVVEALSSDFLADLLRHFSVPTRASNFASPSAAPMKSPTGWSAARPTSAWPSMC